MHLPLLTRILVLIVQFGILVIALPNVGTPDKTMADSANEIMDNLLDSDSNTEPVTATEDGGCVAVNVPRLAEDEVRQRPLARPGMMKRASSWSGFSYSVMKNLGKAS